VWQILVVNCNGINILQPLEDANLFLHYMPQEATVTRGVARGLGANPPSRRLSGLLDFFMGKTGFKVTLFSLTEVFCELKF